MSIAAPATNPASDLELKLPATIGTAGQVLRNSATAGTVAFGGNNILQIKSSTKTDAFQKGTTTAWFDIDGTDETGSGSVWECNITPLSATSKFLVYASVNASATYHSSMKLVRDSTDLLIGDASGNQTRATWYPGYSQSSYIHNCSTFYLDSPGTTSAVTYKVQGATPHSATYTFAVNQITGGGADSAYVNRVGSVITVMEFAT